MDWLSLAPVVADAAFDSFTAPFTTRNRPFLMALEGEFVAGGLEYKMGVCSIVMGCCC